MICWLLTAISSHMCMKLRKFPEVSSCLKGPERSWGPHALDIVWLFWTSKLDMLINGNSRILRRRYCTIFLAIFWGYIPLHGPYIGLIYGRYLQFRFLKWPLMLIHVAISTYFYHLSVVFYSQRQLRMRPGSGNGPLAEAYFKLLQRLPS